MLNSFWNLYYSSSQDLQDYQLEDDMTLATYVCKLREPAIMSRVEATARWDAQGSNQPITINIFQSGLTGGHSREADVIRL